MRTTGRTWESECSFLGHLNFFERGEGRGGAGRGAPSQFSEGSVSVCEDMWAGQKGAEALNFSEEIGPHVDFRPRRPFSVVPIVKLGNGRHGVKTL